MIIEWLGYALLVSALVSVAAWLAERGARAQRWPTRWVWAGAVVVSVVAPLLAWLLPGAPAAATPLVGVPGAYVLESLPVLPVRPAAPTGPSPGGVILMLWLSSSVLLLLGVAVLAARLGIRLRGWPRRVVDGVEVRVSRDTGPAAMGVVRGVVVVPEWALGLEPEQRRLLVLHEAEHVRARDPQLALLGLMVCVLAPWNVPLWWQLGRLRLALEMDCDARVLRRSPDPRLYGSLLVTVGRRKAHLALALAESKSMLERRIQMITNRTVAGAPVRTLSLALASVLVLAVACETPGPTGPSAVEQKPLEIEATRAAVAAMECEPAVYLNRTLATLDDVDPDNVEAIHVFKGPATADVRDDGEACGVIVVLTKDASAVDADAARRLLERLSGERLERAGVEDRRQPAALEQVQASPTFTPMTVRPQLKNAAEVSEALQQAYPPLLREAGLGGTVSVSFLIDREGVVQRTLIKEPSEHSALDDAALAVAERMEFTPAYNRDERVPVWVALPIAFESRAGADAPDAAEAQRPDEDAATAEAASREGVVGQKLTFTPMTNPPKLRNSRETARSLQRHYPPLLREAGIGGTVSVWFFLDASGRVVKVQVKESSGHDALDEAALAVAREMEFAPAQNGDQPVPVWVALDIRFEAHTDDTTGSRSTDTP